MYHFDLCTGSHYCCSHLSAILLVNILVLKSTQLETAGTAWKVINLTTLLRQ